jgi:predicted anti-sigma-YlaC factor YlaD
MDCKKIETYLLDYFYHETEPETHKKVQAHLQHCVHCQAKHQKLSAILGSHSVYDELHPNEFMATRIIAKLQQKTAPALRIRLMQYFLRPAFLVSLICLGIFAGIKISNGISLTSTSAATSDQSNSTLSEQFASENYLTNTNDKYIELYLNNK